MRIKLFAILAIVLSCEAKPQSVNPCLALKLAFCKVKKEFAEENGIRPKAPAPVRTPVQTPFQTPGTTETTILGFDTQTKNGQSFWADTVTIGYQISKEEITNLIV
jgi:hypothetical protein